MLANLLASIALATGVPTPVRLPATVSDAYALRVNPGGLAFVRGGELRLLYGREIPDFTPAIDGLALNGAVSIFDALALGAGFDFDILQSGQTEGRFSLGLAFGGHVEGFGLSWEHLGLAGRPNKDIFNTGLEVRFFDSLSGGFAIRDFGQTAGRRQYDLGFAVRPLTDRLTIGATWRVTQGQKAFGDDQNFQFRADAEPFDGVYVGLGANWLHSARDDDFGMTGSLGLAFDALSIATGVQDTTQSLEVTSEIVYSSHTRPNFVPRQKVAVVELEGELVPAASFNLLTRSIESTPYGALPLRLDKLTRSERAIGLYLRIAPLSVGWAKIEELRNIILSMRSSGRRVDCELTGSGDLEYFLASACSSIIVAPAMSVELNGVAANVLFFADALDKVGVKVEAVARGRYKSAPEQFTRSGMSPSQREALDAYLDKVYGTIVEGISSARKIDRADVERLLAKGTMTATEAKAARLVDAVLYPDEIDPHVDELYGRSVSYSTARNVDPEPRESWGQKPRIAIVHVESTISGGESRNLPFGFGQSSGAQTIVGALEQVRLDPTVRAVVLRVDSPGGDAYASDLIARAVQLLDQQKPVIASFGDVAASGGYYVAAPARTILAEPTTLTGSIGVFSLKLSLEELLAKVGVHHDAIEKGPLSNEGTIYRDMTDVEREAMEKSVDQAYRKFLDVVAKGRKKAVEDVRKIAEGRIWSGEEAKRIGLVDDLGGLLEALALAREEAGLEDYEPVDIVSLPALRESLPISVAASLGSSLGLVDDSPANPWVRLVPHGVKSAIAALLGDDDETRRPLALLPFGLDVD